MVVDTTVMHLFRSGDHIITAPDIYAATDRPFAELLTDHGLQFSFVDMGDPEDVVHAITPATKAIWIETPSNPLLNLVDVVAICGIANQRDLLTIVDNTFLTPYFQQPLQLSADTVVHSTTKYLRGHCDVVGDALVCKDAEIGAKVAALTNALGTCCSPLDAWLVLRGIRSLPYRMESHAKNALALAEFLQERPEVNRVFCPGCRRTRSTTWHAGNCRASVGCSPWNCTLDGRPFGVSSWGWSYLHLPSPWVAWCRWSNPRRP
jgi:cystathionine beta-lyase/cystathionine gamma-synthase